MADLNDVMLHGGMFGSCGILDKSINECELIIPTFSYRDEGTSYHYVEPSDYIEIKNSGDLIGIFEELKIPYRKGKNKTKKQKKWVFFI